MPRRVAIVGGGVAGLQAARALRKWGFSPVIYERASSLGGVWRSNYDGFGIQVPKMLYEFPDFPAPYGDYASGPEVMDYILSYANYHDLVNPSVLKLNTAVEMISRDTENNTWSVRTSTGEDVTFDAVVVASGLYHKPFMPQYPGNFSGVIVHSSEFTDVRTKCEGKDVVVIGAGKSAVDCAIAARIHGASSVTMLFRQAHWGVPRMIAGFIPFHWVFLSRFGQLLVSIDKGAWPTASASVKRAHNMLKYVIKPVVRILEILFAWQLGHNGKFRPERNIVADFYGGAHVVDLTMRDLLNNNEILLEKGEVERLIGDSIILKGGKTLKADVLVLGTGFQRDYSALFDSTTLSLLDVESDGLWLYRSILPIKLPNLAFVGSEVATLSNIGTHSLQAEWLARAWSGKMGDLPSMEIMANEVNDHKIFSRGWMPFTSTRSNLVLLHQTHYHDQLCKDMDEPWCRKGNWLAELFAPYGPADYASVIAQ